MPQYYKRNL